MSGVGLVACGVGWVPSSSGWVADVEWSGKVQHCTQTRQVVVVVAGCEGGGQSPQVAAVVEVVDNIL